tara:strand:- start:1228 stop:1707 length:480 start_codon:yes stop_codon:yes gene_type:complete
MRFNEIKQIHESMSFHAYKKKPGDNYFSMVTGDEDQYKDEVYKTDFDGDPADFKNPNYNPEHDLNLSNYNAGEVFTELGYDVYAGSIPIDEFIARATQWLQKNIGKPSPEQEPEVSKTPGGMTSISGGKREGYFNDVIMRMNKIARDGKAMGATHVGAN